MARDFEGETPLSIARKNGHTKIVELILNKYPEPSPWESIKKPTAAILVLGGMVAWIRAFCKGALELRDNVTEYWKSFKRWQRNRQKPRKASPVLPGPASAHGYTGDSIAGIALSVEERAARIEAEKQRKAREEAEQKREKAIAESSKQVERLINSINKARREGNRAAVGTYIEQLLAELVESHSGLTSEVRSRMGGLIRSLNRDPRREELERELARIEQLE